MGSPKLLQFIPRKMMDVWFCGKLLEQHFTTNQKGNFIVTRDEKKQEIIKVILI